MSLAEITSLVEESGLANRLALIFVETPANPTNALIDIADCRRVADHFSTPKRKVALAVDNTYMGPIWQHPLQHGADLVIYSATKYIGGHSDVIAGAVLGHAEPMKRVKTLRTFLGNMASPWTGWLLMRSLETLKLRMEKQVQNAQKVAKFLNRHPKIERVNYLGLLEPGDQEYEIYRRQCLSPGAMLSFDLAGGEKEAFQFLNHLQLFKLAVSLGSTESLAEHPFTMTHIDVDWQDKMDMGITPKMVRLSIGVENYRDIIADIRQALDAVEVNNELELKEMMG
jgi:methionine-gamma-lyase